MSNTFNAVTLLNCFQDIPVRLSMSIPYMHNWNKVIICNPPFNGTFHLRKMGVNFDATLQKPLLWPLNGSEALAALRIKLNPPEPFDVANFIGQTIYLSDRPTTPLSYWIDRGVSFPDEYRQPIADEEYPEIYRPEASSTDKSFLTNLNLSFKNLEVVPSFRIPLFSSLIEDREVTCASGSLLDEDSSNLEKHDWCAFFQIIDDLEQLLHQRYVVQLDNMRNWDMEHSGTLLDQVRSIFHHKRDTDETQLPVRKTCGWSALSTRNFALPPLLPLRI